MNTVWLDERIKFLILDWRMLDDNRVTETEDATLNIPSGDSSGGSITGTQTLCTTLSAAPAI